MINKGYVAQFCEYYEYPEDAKWQLLLAEEKLLSQNEVYEELNSLVDIYENNYNSLNEELLQKVKSAAEKLGVHEYTFNMLFYIFLTLPLKKEYENQGLTELFDDTVLDLKWKLFECFNLYGVWGTFDPVWFIRAFTLKLFGFGRLQFEIAKCPVSYSENGININEGDMALSTHIPSSGPLLISDCEESFKRADEFFRKKYKQKSCLFFCYSWLLYPQNPNYLPPESNVLKFMDMFKIVKSIDDPQNEDLWRIFYKKSYNDIDELPLNTSMQRSVAEWLKNGNSLGYGIGLIIFKNGRKVHL